MIVLRNFFYHFLIVLFLLRQCNNKVIQVGMCDYAPMIFCPTGYSGPPTDDFDGMSYWLLQDIITELGWTSDDYQINCMEWTPMMDAVYSGEIDMALGGITISASRIKSGYKFSQPTFETGSTLIFKTETSPMIFLNALDIYTGIAIICSTFIVGGLMHYFEGKKQSYFYYMWNQWAQLFFVNDIKINSTPGRIIQGTYLFTILIVVSSYTAYIAAILTQEQVFKYSGNLSQIYGKRIAAGQVYREIIQSYGAIWVKKSEIIDAADVSDFMIANDLDGLVEDDVGAQVMVHRDCSLLMVNRFFHSFGYGIIFSPSISTTFVNKISQTLVDLQNQNSYYEDISNIIAGRYDNCEFNKLEKELRFSGNGISIKNVEGLWLILGIFILVGFGIHLLKMVYFWVRNKRIFYYTSPYAENDKTISEIANAIVRIHLNEVEGKIAKSIESLEQFLLRMKSKHNLNFRRDKLKRFEINPEYNAFNEFDSMDQKEEDGLLCKRVVVNLMNPFAKENLQQDQKEVQKNSSKKVLPIQDDYTFRKIATLTKRATLKSKNSLSPLKRSQTIKNINEELGLQKNLQYLENSSEKIYEKLKSLKKKTTTDLNKHTKNFIEELENNPNPQVLYDNMDAFQNYFYNYLDNENNQPKQKELPEDIFQNIGDYLFKED